MITATPTTTNDVSDVQRKPLPTQTSSFRIFAIVWAMASLFHMAHSGVFDTRLNFALLTIAALYVLFRPTLSGFLALILLQLLDVAVQMPNATNHWVFTAFVNLTILQSVFYCIFKNKSFNIDEAELFDTFAPVARVEILILYGWAVFHKLNSGFFSDVSCAATLLEAQHLDALILAFPQIISFNPYFTIFVELAIAIMLFFRITRPLGVLIGLLFHLVLSYSSYNAFFDFTSMVVAAYFLFTGNEFNRRTEQWIKMLREKIKVFFQSYSLTRLIGTCLLGISLLGLIVVLNKRLQTFQQFHLHFFWTLYAVVLTYVMVRYLFVPEISKKQSAFAFKSKWFLILPAIVFLNGTSPYLGLKTENSYSMFSNLRTEGGMTNHYIIPASTQIFNFQSNLIEIVSSSDEKLQRLADQSQLMVLFEFKRYLKKNDVDEVVYRLNGKLDVYRKGETSLEGVLQPESAFLFRLMRFRNISKFEPQPCAH
jgi:hypothetical protein